MKYFEYEQDSTIAIDKWISSQFDLADIVLSLTDNNLYIGEKLYFLFSREEVLTCLQYFSCNFIQIKKELGINGFYVEREGNIFSKNWNPKRNLCKLTFEKEIMNEKAKMIYKNLLQDLEYIAKLLQKQTKHKIS